MRRILTFVGAALLAGVMLTGCFATGSNVELTPAKVQTARIATKLGVQIGVLQYVGEDVAKAKRVLDGIDTVKALINEEDTVDIFTVQAFVNKLIDDYIAPEQTPQQILLLKNAVTLVVTDIELIVPSGLLTPDVKERVMFYLNAVEEALVLVIGAPPPVILDDTNSETA